MNVPSTPPTSSRAPLADAPRTAGAVERKLFGADGFDFGDVLDAVNPLHHVPVVGTLYRDWTGDDIAHGPRVVGDGILGLGLFGTAIGLVGSVANVVVEELTGKDVGEHVLGWFRDEEAPADGAAPAGAPVDGEPDDVREGALPEYLEIARIADREVERIDSAAPAGAVRARAELAAARDEPATRAPELALARALAAYRTANAVDPWVRLADRVR
ncbi:MAG: hypothetical protein ACF8XB_20985 [Planctomycetota bacterium JB042]